MNEQAVAEFLARDPMFPLLSKEEQKKRIADLLAVPDPQPNQEQPEVLNPSAVGMGRPFDPTSTTDLGWTLAQGVGSGVGSLLGAEAVSRGLQALPHPVPKAVGTAVQLGARLAGAGAGGAAVGGTRAAINQALGQPDKPVGEAMRDAAIEGAIGEAVGSAVVGAVRAIPKALTGPPVKPDVIAAAKQRGVQFSIAEETEKRLPAFIQERQRSSMTVASAMEKFIEHRQKALRQWAEDLATQYFQGPIAPSTGGGRMQQIIKGESLPYFKAVADRLYKKLDDLPPIRPVWTKQILDQLNQLDQELGRFSAPTAKGILADVRAEIATFNPVTGTWVPKSVPFSKMHDIRSRLLQIGRAHTDVVSDRVGGLAKHVANRSIHDAMEQTAKAAGDDAYLRWKRTDLYYAKGMEIFNDAVISGALRARPEDVIDVTFTKRGITEAKKVMAALKRANNPNEAIQLYRQTAMGRLFEKATVDGKLDLTKLDTAVYGANGVGEDTMRVVFGDEFMKEFKLLIGAIRKASFVSKRDVAGNPSGTANSMIQWVEGSYVITLGVNLAKDLVQGTLSPGTLSMAVGAGSYVLTSKALHKLMMTPDGIALLRKALLTKPTSQEAIKLAPRLVSIIGPELITATEPKE